MTSVKKRLDRVLNELGTLGTEADETTAKNIIAQLQIVAGAYRETQTSPMCCFYYDANQNIACDVAGPLSPEEFMQTCKACQAQIKTVLSNLNTDSST